MIEEKIGGAAALACFVATLVTLAPADAHAESWYRRTRRHEENTSPAAGRTGIGMVITGVGGLLTSGTNPSTGSGFDEPTPLVDKELRLSGERGTGGFATDLVARISDVRLGFGATLLFAKRLELSTLPLDNGFSARATSTLDGMIYGFLGKQLRLLDGDLLPYADILIGTSFLQTGIRLDHPQLGYLGQTPYTKFRFSLGPRVGVAVPLGGPFFIDVAARADFLGFFTVGGQAGFGVFVGK